MLNERQRLAVATTEGPVLMIAGPGTGKTRTIVERVVYLLVDKNVQPEHIFVTTFTRKAALELQTRITEKLEACGHRVSLQDMYIGTMHSVFLRILQENHKWSGLQRGCRLLDEFEQTYLVYESLDEFLEIPYAFHLSVKETRREDPTPLKQSERLIYWMNKISDESVPVDTLAASQDVTLQAMAGVYRLYERKLTERNVIDFGLIQTRLLDMLANYPDVLQRLQRQFRYMMIDEYQDTNTVQEQLIGLLAGHYKNLCVVGDDDQSIYRFRGATVQNLIDFKKLYPGCAEIKLELNYRSHPRIVKFYQSWMEQCEWEDGPLQYRLDKRIQAHIQEKDRTTRVVRCGSHNGIGHWMEEVHGLLRKLMDDGVIENWNQVAFLFKSVKHSDVTQLAAYLEDREVPVYAPRMGRFFWREEVMLVIGALTAVVYPSIAPGGLPLYFREALDKFGALVREDNDLLEWGKTQRFKAGSSGISFVEMFYDLLRFPVFSQFVAIDYIDNAKQSRETRNMAALSSLLVRFETLRPPVESTLNELASGFISFLSFLFEKGVHEYEDDSDYVPEDAVSFMTFHQSKGLEFPIVIVSSLNRKPFQDADLTGDALRELYTRTPLEPADRTADFDFYREYYTAFSRAQELLILTGYDSSAANGYGRTDFPAAPFLRLYGMLADWRHPLVHLHELKLERIRRINLLDSYAFTSHIQLFARCPRQYLLYRLYGFESSAETAANLGNLVHYAIEDIHHALLEGEPVDEHIIDALVRGHYATMSVRHALFMHVLEEASEHVRRYHRLLTEWSPQVLGAEQSVFHAERGYQLNGKIDVIFANPDDSMQIVDFKTGRYPNTDDQLEGYKKQLYLYAYLLEQKLRKPVKAMHLFFSGEPERSLVTFEMEADRLAAFLSEFRHVISEIQQNHFHVGEFPKRACNRCDFHKFCRSAVN